MRRKAVTTAASAHQDGAALIRWSAAVLFLLLAAIAVAHAQGTSPGTREPSAPQQIVPPSDPTARSKGVIPAPSGIDPGISAPAPHADGIMPVIPPPGTPGGNPQVVPK